ncbi:MAG: RNA-binding S4 domain-containing protein [Steroidobacteraceae bacterium]
MRSGDQNAKGALAAAVPTLRLDKWLWCARFFKSRSQATDAVSGGHVHVNGDRAKAARDVKIGDSLDITRETVRMQIVVLSLPLRRGPASEARACYEETAASLQLRETQRERQCYSGPAPTHKPNKQERRALRGLKGR